MKTKHKPIKIESTVNYQLLFSKIRNAKVETFIQEPIDRMMTFFQKNYSKNTIIPTNF